MKTIEQAIEKYGDVELEFSHYYKYVFTFEGITEDGVFISAGVGGESGDIYRMEVVNNETGTLKSINPISVSIEGTNIEHFYWDNY